MEGKNNNKLFIVAIICVLLCIPIGIIIGKTIYGNVNNNTILEEKETDNYNFKKLVNEFTDNHGYESDKLKELYVDKNLSNQYKTQIVFELNDNEFKIDTNELNSCVNQGYINCSQRYLSLDRAQEIYNHYFEGSIATDFAFCPYLYNSSKKMYVRDESCGGTGNSGYFSYIYKYTSKGNDYYAYVAAGYWEYLINDYAINGIIYYSDVLKNKEYKRVKTLTDNVINETNYEEFDHFKLKFKQNSNGDIIYQGIEKIN